MSQLRKYFPGLDSLRNYLHFGIPGGFFRNVSWQYVASMWTMGIGFVYALLVGRHLGAAEFGLIALGLGFASMVFEFVELRLHEVTIRYITEFWETGETSLTLAFVKLTLLTNLATAGLALLVIAGLSPYAQDYLIRDSRGSVVLLLSGLSLFFISLAYPTSQGLLRVLALYRSQAVVSICGTTLKLALTLGVMWGWGWGVMGVMGVAVAASLVTNLSLLGVALWHLNRHIPFRRTPAPLRLLWPRLLEIRRFVLNTYFLSITSIPVRNLDINLLGWFTSLEVVGVYRVAKNFMTAMFTITDPTFIVVYPELAKMWTKRQPAEMKVFIKKLTWMLGILALVLFVSTFLLVPQVIQLVMGKEFAGAGLLFRCMAWGILFWAPVMWANPLLMAAGRPDLTLKASLLGSVIILGLYLVCVPLWGGIGTALVNALSAPVGMALTLWLGLRAGIIFPQFRPVPIS
jgi:O-antigen/teichoic acid export membrane protein